MRGLLMVQGLGCLHMSILVDTWALPNLSIRPHTEKGAEPSEDIKQEGKSSSYFNTEWKDWEQNRNSKTFEKRGTHYLGCKRVADRG